jgi:hypothetical protein
VSETPRPSPFSLGLSSEQFHRSPIGRP